MNARDILEVESKDLVVHLMWEERKWVTCRITPRFLSWVGGFMNGGDSSPERDHKKTRNPSSSPGLKISGISVCNNTLSMINHAEPVVSTGVLLL